MYNPLLIPRGKSGEAKAGVTNEEAKIAPGWHTRMCIGDLGHEKSY